MQPLGFGQGHIVSQMRTEREMAVRVSLKSGGVESADEKQERVPSRAEPQSSPSTIAETPREIAPIQVPATQAPVIDVSPQDPNPPLKPPPPSDGRKRYTLSDPPSAGSSSQPQQGLAAPPARKDGPTTPIQGNLFEGTFGREEWRAINENGPHPGPAPGRGPQGRPPLQLQTGGPPMRPPTQQGPGRMMGESPYRSSASSGEFSGSPADGRPRQRPPFDDRSYGPSGSPASRHPPRGLPPSLAAGSPIDARQRFQDDSFPPAPGPGPGGRPLGAPRNYREERDALLGGGGDFGASRQRFASAQHAGPFQGPPGGPPGGQRNVSTPMGMGPVGPPRSYRGDDGRQIGPFDSRPPVNSEYDREPGPRMRSDSAGGYYPPPGGMRDPRMDPRTSAQFSTQQNHPKGPRGPPGHQDTTTTTNPSAPPQGPIPRNAAEDHQGQGHISHTEADLPIKLMEGAEEGGSSARADMRLGTLGMKPADPPSRDLRIEERDVRSLRDQQEREGWRSRFNEGEHMDSPAVRVVSGEFRNQFGGMQIEQGRAYTPEEGRRDSFPTPPLPPQRPTSNAEQRASYASNQSDPRIYTRPDSTIVNPRLHPVSDQGPVSMEQLPGRTPSPLGPPDRESSGGIVVGKRRSRMDGGQGSGSGQGGMGPPMTAGSVESGKSGEEKARRASFFNVLTKAGSKEQPAPPQQQQGQMGPPPGPMAPGFPTQQPPVPGSAAQMQQMHQLQPSRSNTPQNQMNQRPTSPPQQQSTVSSLFGSRRPSAASPQPGAQPSPAKKKKGGFMGGLKSIAKEFATGKRDKDRVIYQQAQQTANIQQLQQQQQQQGQGQQQRPGMGPGIGGGRAMSEEQYHQMQQEQFRKLQAQGRAPSGAHIGNQLRQPSTSAGTPASPPKPTPLALQTQLPGLYMPSPQGTPTGPHPGSLLRSDTLRSQNARESMDAIEESLHTPIHSRTASDWAAGTMEREERERWRKLAAGMGGSSKGQVEGESEEERAYRMKGERERERWGGGMSAIDEKVGGDLDGWEGCANEKQSIRRPSEISHEDMPPSYPGPSTSAGGSSSTFAPPSYGHRRAPSDTHLPPSASVSTLASGPNLSRSASLSISQKNSATNLSSTRLQGLRTDTPPIAEHTANFGVPGSGIAGKLAMAQQMRAEKLERERERRAAANSSSEALNGSSDTKGKGKAVLRERSDSSASTSRGKGKLSLDKALPNPNSPHITNAPMAPPPKTPLPPPPIDIPSRPPTPPTRPTSTANPQDITPPPSPSRQVAREYPSGPSAEVLAKPKPVIPLEHEFSSEKIVVMVEESGEGIEVVPDKKKEEKEGEEGEEKLTFSATAYPGQAWEPEWYWMQE